MNNEIEDNLIECKHCCKEKQVDLAFANGWKQINEWTYICDECMNDEDEDEDWA